MQASLDCLSEAENLGAVSYLNSGGGLKSAATYDASFDGSPDQNLVFGGVPFLG